MPPDDIIDDREPPIVTKDDADDQEVRRRAPSVPMSSTRSRAIGYRHPGAYGVLDDCKFGSGADLVAEGVDYLARSIYTSLSTSST